jgi:hypothetical protein
VETILNVVIGATGELFRNLCPSWSKSQVRLRHLDLFFERPLDLFDVGLQLVDPALSTLLGYAAGDQRSARAPALFSNSLDVLCDDQVLRLSPPLFSK